MKNYRKIMLTSVIFIMTMVGFSTVSSANGLTEDKSWQFQTPNKNAVLLGNENLRLSRLGGKFQQWQQNQTFNCDAGSTCTIIGNGGIGSQATTIGNLNKTSTVISTDNSVITNVGDGSTVDISSNGNSGATGNTASSNVTVDQNNTDSSLGASVNIVDKLNIGNVTSILGNGVDSYQPNNGQ